ncbi:hypothetical protein EMCRGX_G011897 [Ephydatia muelleri]
MSATILVNTADDLSGTSSVRFVNNLPVVKDKTITVFVQANKQTDAIYCQAIGTTSGTVDCSNGAATFNNVPAGEGHQGHSSSSIQRSVSHPQYLQT